jgi:hypothetical protein
MDASKGHKLVEPFHKTRLEDNDQLGGFVGRIEKIIEALQVKLLRCQFWNTPITDNPIRYPRPCASKFLTRCTDTDSWMPLLRSLQQVIRYTE